MSIRRLFVSVFVAFAIASSGIGGFLAWREASKAVEAELDTRATWVAGAAAETGLQSGLLLGLEPGFEDLSAWTSTNSKLARLRRYVAEAYIVDEDNTAVVSSHPADSVPIGTRLSFLDQFGPELEQARTLGNATTLAFTGSDGRLYKWGFAQLEQSPLVLAVLMQADYLSPLALLKQNLLMVSALAALVAAILGALMAAGIIEPLERLSRVALRIQRGHMSKPVDLEPGEELGRLSRAMERMRRGVLERDEQLRLMLAQVAHEIRNPLGGVELFAAAAADSEDAAERRRLIARVRSEVSGLNVIIDDFLAFARPLAPSHDVTDLREPLWEATELIRGVVENAGGELQVDLPKEPLMARIGADHIKRVTLNLLRNAAQVSSTVRLRAWGERGEVVVSVSDEGPGVPEALRDRIFNPFVTDKEQGAGLGLAIVKKVAEAHGGRVELHRTGETNGVRGSEFRLYFESLEDLPPPPVLRGE
ncbi:MAG TPA: ATP-binding protein [Longimicrobiales bacterium]|nr:ATP-binding protein [Longimicrobiales bacterium]